MRTGKLRKWKARDGYRWQVRAGNGEEISGSTEGYEDKRDRDKSIEITLAVLLASLSKMQLIRVYEQAAALIRGDDDGGEG